MQAWGLTILRIVTGAIFIAHGFRKFFITGLPGVESFMKGAGLPYPLASAALVSVAELFGGLALVAGFMTRFAAFPLAIAMLVATVLVHWRAGFFLPDGYEFTLLLAAACLAIALGGPGAMAIGKKRR